MQQVPHRQCRAGGSEAFAPILRRHLRKPLVGKDARHVTARVVGGLTVGPRFAHSWLAELDATINHLVSIACFVTCEGRIRQLNHHSGK